MNSGFTRERTLRRLRAFTLIELLVSIAIIGVLLALSIPVLAATRQTAQSTRCLANLRSIGLGLTAYMEQNRQRLVYTISDPDAITSPEPFQTLAPFIGAEIPGAGREGRVAYAEPYACPADKALATDPVFTGFSYTYQPIPEFRVSGPEDEAVATVSRYYWGPP